MKRILLVAAAICAAHGWAEAAKLSSIKRAWRKQMVSIGTAPDAKVGRLRGDARREYSKLHSADMGEGTSVIGLTSQRPRKGSVAKSTFAVFMHAGVGDHIRVFRRSDHKLIASGEQIDGSFRWNKLK